MKVLYVDMDGVLCDYAKQCRLLLDVHPKESVGQYRARVGRNGMQEAIRATEGVFWSTMPPMCENIVAHWDRMRALYPRIVILSAPDEDDPCCEEGKNQWLDQWLGPERCPERIFRRDKWALASPDGVLVDDQRSNLVDWGQAGGWSAVLFKGSYDVHFWSALNETLTLPRLYVPLAD
jgi:hypothetical protein